MTLNAPELPFVPGAFAARFRRGGRWLLGLLGVTALHAQAPEVPPELARMQADFLRMIQAADRAEAAANDKVGGKWRGVSRIKGQARLSSRTEINESDLVPHEVAHSTEEVIVRFELDRDDSNSGGGVVWRAREVFITSAKEAHSHFRIGSDDTTMTASAGYRGLPDRLEEISLTLNTEDGKWQMGTPGFSKDKYTVTRHWSGVRDGKGINEVETELDNRVESVVFNGTIGDRPALTTGNFEYTGLAASKSTRPFVRRGQIQFWPEFDEYALEVAIADYGKWRPLGSVAKPATPGNSLTAKATVVTKGKGEPPQVKAIRFELLDVSREPGVCLNWPLGATDRNPDLRLASAPMTPGTLTAEDQRLEVKTPIGDEKGRPYALAQIDSYDFGSRATLRVTCELVDGRELVGELKGENAESSQDLIRLPQMNGPDWIAAVWKKENDVVALPDADDREKIEGQQYDGDGFTLYEEYRGWVVEGKRIEGDPKRKDFFVLNLIGADARKGIDLFEKVSQLRVHSKLKRSEISEKTRLMNGNHRDAPQRVQQHGVWVKTFDSTRSLGGTGAFTPLTKAGVSGRPGLTVGVGLLPRSHEDSAFNKPFNLPKYYSVFAFDRAIAHELLHSVGVEHHGDEDGTLSAKWVSPRHPLNKVGRPYFREMATFGPHKIMTILDENGHDLAAQYMTEYARDAELTRQWHWDKWIAEGKDFIAKRQGYKLELDTPEKYAERELEDSVGRAFYAEVLGRPGGEHSGVQDCLMRYYFAKFYPVKGKAETYYMVTPGTEPFGMELCRSKGGTGVNAASRQPQSRYGDASENGGSCFGQICPNDAIPPKKL